MIEYLAHANQSESLEEANWEALAFRLKVPVNQIKEVIRSLTEEQKHDLWVEVIEKRVNVLSANQVFTSIKWTEVEAKAVDRILEMLKNKLIRDPNELIAVAKIANGLTQEKRSHEPQRGVNVNNLNIGFGSAPPGGTNGEETMGIQLPSEINQMSIDLAPRVAQALQKVNQDDAPTYRVIDADRITTGQLRELQKGREADNDE